MVAASTDRARLEQRPEATAHQVDDLLAKVRSGQLRLPDFQRKLKWQARDMLDLFDSLYRGFPVGALLLWKRAAGAGPVRYGDLVIEAPERTDALWIVDGQQRVTTLASNLLIRHAPKERALLFDLEEERFLFGPVPAEDPSLPGMEAVETRAVAVQDLFDSTRAIAWMAARFKTMRPEIVQRALECGKRLREYQVPVYVVETEDEDILREIFGRINRTGRRLDDTDVFTALFATTGAEGGRLDLGHVARRVARLGFGTLEEATILKSLRAVCELPLDKDFTKDLTRAEAGQALALTEASLERTTRFLQSHGFPHRALVPYDLVFVVLSRFFHLHPGPSTRNELLLRRWVWRGSLAGKLAGASVSLRQHVEAVDTDEASSVQRLLALDPGAESSPPSQVDLGVFRTDRAKGALAACALASLEPRHLATGEALDVPTLFEREPRRPLPEVVAHHDDAIDLSRSVANRLMHPPISPRDAAAAIRRADAAVLHSHGIPEEARDALGRGDAAGFLAGRARLLDERLGAFFRRQAEYGADDSPAIDAIVTDEEP
jgi:hypothetical protein